MPPIDIISYNENMSNLLYVHIMCMVMPLLNKNDKIDYNTTHADQASGQRLSYSLDGQLLL